MSTTPRFPSSPALRLRRLLYERGLRLEPWASQEQIFETFLSHLAHDEHSDAYWHELTKLVTQLAADLHQHRPQSALTQSIAVDTDALMRELRVALAESRANQNDFRSLGRRVTAPTMWLLLLVALVVVGCGGQTDGTGSGGATPTDTTGGTGAQTSGGTGGASSSTGGQDLIDISIGGATWDPELPQLASGAPSWGSAAGAAGATSCIPDRMTFREMIEACVTDSDARNEYLGALEQSHPDWATFVRDYFRCKTCGDVLEYLDYCTHTELGDANAPSEGDDIYDFCRPIMIYAGVRFS